MPAVLTQATWKVRNLWVKNQPELAKISQQFELNKELIESAQKFTEEDAFKHTPKAKFGAKSHLIAIPNDLPVVIRLISPSDGSHFSRVEKQEQAFTICQMNHLNNLAVPRGKIQGNFIIEERVGSGEHKVDHQALTFYSENLTRFDSAVKEFTTFLCKSSLGDIVDGASGISMGFANNQFHAGYPRYDNVLLFEEEGRCKIGLIDLDDFNLLSKEPQFSHIRDAVSSAIALFPHHADIIMQEGYENLPRKEPMPTLDEFKKIFQPNIQNQLNYCAALVGNRIEELKKKGVTPETPYQFTISPEIQQKIQSEIKTELLKIREQDFTDIVVSNLPSTNSSDRRIDSYQIPKENYNYLNNLSEEDLNTLIDTVIPVILDGISKLVEEEVLTKHPLGGLTNGQLLESRTLYNIHTSGNVILPLLINRHINSKIDTHQEKQAEAQEKMEVEGGAELKKELAESLKEIKDLQKIFKPLRNESPDSEAFGFQKIVCNLVLGKFVENGILYGYTNDVLLV